ncbi:MAG TPA: NAD-dependent epimerase/dehydratase family protein, partial [Chthoniobacterales bacterium]|nr:NAD-dependent epimerase/dehydratase family protein [Chthoniobacterales bacterium]
MRLLITGVCGFVGSGLATWFRQHKPSFELVGIDNFIRPGSETNRMTLKFLGVAVHHGDVRNASDFENLPKVDWVIDAAANPSVLAGADDRTSSRQLVEHNLQGTLNMLEYCKRIKAGLVLLSTSRVYSIRALSSLPLVERALTFEWEEGSTSVAGASRNGLDVDFS